MDNVQERNNCTNLPSSQTFRSYQLKYSSRDLVGENVFKMLTNFNNVNQE
jgi:hypothetical protein